MLSPSNYIKSIYRYTASIKERLKTNEWVIIAKMNVDDTDVGNSRFPSFLY